MIFFCFSYTYSIQHLFFYFIIKTISLLFVYNNYQQSRAPLFIEHLAHGFYICYRLSCSFCWILYLLLFPGFPTCYGFAFKR